MEKVLEEYWNFYKNHSYAEVNLSALQKHINDISVFAEATNNAIAIYDNYIYKPVYMSDTYKNFFGDDKDSVYPDDEDDVLKSSVIALRYFFKKDKNIKHHRLIRKYRAKIKTNFCVVIEQLRPIEFDTQGRVWLSLVIIDIAPEQNNFSKVEYKIFNFKTGDIISPVDTYFDGQPILSEREIEILRLINQGFLSKEISEKLFISIHTVSKHRQNILEKLKVDTSIEAIKYASALGIL